MSTITQLENLRNRLLDLTNRNKLLNFKHTKSASIRIIDELPDQLVETLLADKAMKFISIPDPTESELIAAGYLKYDEENDELIKVNEYPSAEAWAKYIGLDTRYEVPTLNPDSDETPDRHTDFNIQTLFFPDEMDVRLNKVRLTSESAIQEMGANILYLVFGFLEWYESIDSDQKRLAPLYLMPVKLARKLDRRSGKYIFTLKYSGEDILANISLKEKLKRDFGVDIPDLHDEILPESYMKILEEWLGEEGMNRNLSRWKVRRYITLSLLNFSKQLMYLDLDSERWDGDKGILDHRVVKKFLGEGQSQEKEEIAEELYFGEEYDIDNVKNVLITYPIIEDADSSQHSAIIDVIKGKDLIIQGPPGTGKSQTITNLIAAAMFQGKKILFVAEKMAALEVVKRRLDKAGLGDFCLELHSHKSQKKKVLEEIKKRLDKHGTYRHPDEIDLDIARYEELRKKLRTYADLINSEWKNTSITRHKILTAATRYRKSVALPPDQLHSIGYDGNNFDATIQKSLEDDMERFVFVFQSVLEQVDNGIQSHPWFGIENEKLQMFDMPNVRDALTNWNDAIESLVYFIEDLERQLGVSNIDLASTRNETMQLIEDIEKLPFVDENIEFGHLPLLRDSKLKEASEALELYISIEKLIEVLKADLKTEDLTTLDRTEQYRNGIVYLINQLKDSVYLYQIAESIQGLNALKERLFGLSNELKAIRDILKFDDRTYFDFSYDGLKHYATLISVIGILDNKLIEQRNRLFDNNAMDDVLPQLQEEIFHLRALKKELERDFDLSDLPDAEEILDLKETIEQGGLFKWFKSEWRTARNEVLSLAKKQSITFSKLTKKLSQLAEFSQKKSQFCSNTTYSKLLKDRFACIDTNIEEIIALREWYKKIRDTYGRGFGKEALLAEKLFTLDISSFEKLKDAKDRDIEIEVAAIVEGLNELRKYFTETSLIQKNNIELIGENGLIEKVVFQLSEATENCQPLMSYDNWSLSKLRSIVENLQLLRDQIAMFRSKKILEEIFGEKCALNPSSMVKPEQQKCFETIRRTVEYAEFVANELHSAKLQQILYTFPQQRTVETLKNSLKNLQNFQKNEEKAFDNFASMTQLDEDKWLYGVENKYEKLVEKNLNAIKKAEWLHTWLDYLREKRVVSDAGLMPIVERIENGTLNSTDAIKAFRSGIFDLLAREIFAEDKEIATFSGMTQESIQKQFREYDDKLKKLQSEKIAWQIDQVDIPMGQGSGRVGSFTELSLLRHQIRLQRRHIPIRQLIDRSINALTAAKPCFMMSPMSVSQYLKPGAIEFDIVVMDEASQIKPEDALGAIARGSQIIIVGDPKQLPPTNFFNRVDINEGDDVTVLEESESILDATSVMFPTRQLRWHYRSKHESLIAFSNKEFYDGKLIIFPSPYNENDEYGIKYHRVKNGYFVNRKNTEEARVIAQAVKKHLLEHPHESLGVVAMNVEQRIQIESEIDALIREDPELQTAYDSNTTTTEPLFIKNLENVQGDERDVIFISMTYGRNGPGMPMFQRFGPINSDLGWRRLNVLFTRSKKRMHIFSSMGSDDIVMSSESKKGVVALHGMLKYCETGFLYTTGPEHSQRPPESDFEVTVMETLSRYGFDCVPQVGVAGFYIDIGIKDPGNPGRYLMGIECDGATYHSAKSTRDRDKLRQEILEGLGWKIRRIWSTDWFENPDGVMKPIIDELNRLKSDKAKTIQMKVEENFDEDIEEIITEVENEEKKLLKYEENSKSLRESLEDFERDIIRKKYPNTPKHRKFLKLQMIDALVEYRPTNREEFLATIPSYLRSSIDLHEAEFIEEILEIINMHEEESN